MFNGKSNFILNLFVSCLFLFSAASCQTYASRQTSLNKNQTVSSSGQERTDLRQNKNEENVTVISPASGISITKQDIAQKGERIEDFSPKGWYLMLKAEDDLNGDRLADAVAVFSKAELFDGIDETTHSSAQNEKDINTERLLIVAVRDSAGSLNLDTLSQKAILCRSCGAQLDEPLLGLSVKNESIEIIQGALGTSSANYLHKIKKDADRGWIVFYGEGKFRERRTGKDSSAKQKEPILLIDFNISQEIEKLGLSATSNRKTSR